MKAYIKTRLNGYIVGWIKFLSNRFERKFCPVDFILLNKIDVIGPTSFTTVELTVFY